MRRVALITGGASGLGLQTAKHLAMQGNDVMINYRHSRERAVQLQQRLQQEGIRCELVQGDVSCKEDCVRIVRETVDKLGSLDILVNNAGPYIFERKKLVDYTDEEWELMIKGNLSAVFYLCREAIPLMRQKGWGRIINFGFSHAHEAIAWVHRAAFAAAKVGLVSLTKSLAMEESGHGITVNMVCPGDIVGQHKEQTISEVRREHEMNLAPVGRPGSGEDIARVVAFLAQEDSDFITGSIIDVNGGLNVQGKQFTRNKQNHDRGREK
ncbi:3-oxoacyl-[acyl-carrier protein] reductase [Caldalkalibacillus uzonensis]|uniref:3-oxoacyl-[acyl-carrier protein] reductase n=1 Tax=Caldalkalibacillus uzonensis TaxID=353224 RepID=A0ABU0CMY8_9BACI|nr:SDR family oxidoreductase [Caldalkalibacillus uzonensis]MDQ0337775.1 3-oxoacyl-[acyl-carrier protein] reductase [Caldalkalibacillus uzonensis]